MTKRSTDTSNGSIGQQAGSALDSLVQPVQSVVDSLHETVSRAVAGMTGFMKEPSDTMSRRRESATTDRASARLAKPTARKTTARRPAVARARARR